MQSEAALAVHAKGGRLWHRLSRHDDLLIRTRCHAAFFTTNCSTTVVAMVPIEKRCARCWGRYNQEDIS